MNNINGTKGRIMNKKQEYETVAMQYDIFSRKNSSGVPAIRVATPLDWGELHLYPLGDLHIGSKECDEKNIRRWVKRIADDENAGVLLLGDLIDNGIDIGRYEQKMPIEEQIALIKDILWPIRHKVIGMVSGNHEDRTSRNAGTDISKRIALELEVSDRYFDCGQGVITINVGNARSRGAGVKYTIFFSHGVKNSKTPGGKINGVLDYKSIVSDADLYIQGHVHEAICYYKSACKAVAGAAKKFRQVFLSQGAWLKYGGYGAKKGYAMNDEDQYVITLSGKDYSMPELKRVDPTI